MSKIDITITIILAIGGFFGYKRGFLMELFFLAAIVLGIFIGFKLTGALVDYLRTHLNVDKTFLPYLAFLIIFVVVVVGVVLLGQSIKHMMDKTFLGRMDALAGAMLGIVKYAFCLSVIVWLATSFGYRFPEDWTRGTWFLPSITRFAPRTAAYLSEFLPFFKEIFRQF